ncbi:uncharacterized protein LJ206_017280 [Theristicus caerulescens]
MPHRAGRRSRGHRPAPSRRGRKRPAVPAGAGGKRNGGEKAGENRKPARLGRGAARRGTGCPARFGPVQPGPARRGAVLTPALQQRRGGGALPGRRARLSARRCIAALREPPPSPLPSPPSAVARLRRPGPGHGPAPPRSAPARTEASAAALGSPASRRSRAPPSPGTQPWGGGHAPTPLCPLVGVCHRRSSTPYAGGGTGPPRRGIRRPARPAPHPRHGPAARPGRLPPLPRRAARAVRPAGPPGLAWAAHCPPPSPRVSRGRLGWSRGEPGPAAGPGGVAGRCTGRPGPGADPPRRDGPHGRRGTCAARGAGVRRRPAPRPRPIGKGGW